MNATRARLRGHSAGLRPRNSRGAGAGRRARLEVVVFLVFLLLVVVFLIQIVLFFLVFGFFFLFVALEWPVFRIVIVNAADRFFFPRLRAVVRAAEFALRVGAFAFHFAILTS